MILGIDYGLAKIGVAITEGLIPSPLITLPNNKFFFQNVRERLHGEQPEKIIIGKPKFRPYQELFDLFIENLTQEFNCPVILYEEDFSTREAKIRLGQSQLSRKQKKKDDAMAACIILERYLNEATQPTH